MAVTVLGSVLTADGAVANMQTSFEAAGFRLGKRRLLQARAPVPG